MADKSVGELIAATSVTPTDLFVLEQNGTAKKLTGQILENWLVSFADGHGGIQSIEKIGIDVLADTYRITLADTTTFDFVVTNGRGISNIAKTSTSGLIDTYTITYNDGTKGDFTVANGAKGDKGDNSYIWIKYASQEPTSQSNSFGDVPDNWIGIYFGGLSEAPADWKQYAWFQIKGEKGDTGDPARLISSAVEYQASDSGIIIPSGAWSSSIPVVAQGKYLWTKQALRFNTGDPVTSYSVARFGIDGAGSVVTVAGVAPDTDGNVPLTATDVKALPISGGTMTGSVNMNGRKLTGLNTPTSKSEAATKGYVDTSRELKTYEVVMNTDVVTTGSVTAESKSGIFKIGGYIQLKDKYPADNKTKIFCTVPDVKVVGITYAETVDRNKSNPFQVILYTDATTNATVVQLEGSRVEIAASSWLNFTLFGMLEE